LTACDVLRVIGREEGNEGCRFFGEAGAVERNAEFADLLLPYRL
jgi:hypothetical protein